MSKVKVIICEPGKTPEVKEVEPGISAIKESVGGWFSSVRLTHNILLYTNSNPVELPYNRTIMGRVVRGTGLIARIDSHAQEISLSEEDIEGWVAIILKSKDHPDA